MKTPTGKKFRKAFVLDTSTLLYSPLSLFSFGSKDVFLPISVLDELDGFKTNSDENGKNARYIIRVLHELRNDGSLCNGVPVNEKGGKLYTTTEEGIPPELFTSTADNRILGACQKLKDRYDEVILISKDINLIIKADTLGLSAQDFVEDNKIKEIDELYTGFTTLTVPEEDIDFVYANKVAQLTAQGLFPNQFVMLRGDVNPKHTAMTRVRDDGCSVSLVKKRGPRDVWGVEARNLQQTYALDLLMDDSVQLVTLTGRAGSGKAQPLDAGVLTPRGFVNMGTLKVGDQVITPAGNYSNIIGVYPQGPKEIYRMYFTDGSSAECCKEHLWETRTQKDRDAGRAGSVKSLDDIMKSMRYRDYKRNHSIPMVKTVDFLSDKEPPLDPYLMGVLLGDGSFRNTVSFTTADIEIRTFVENIVKKNGFSLTACGDKYSFRIIDDRRTGVAGASPIISISDTAEIRYENIQEVEKAGFSRNVYRAANNETKYMGRHWKILYNEKPKSSNRIKNILISDGLWGLLSHQKFIPDSFKFTTMDNRIKLLQGLMDTDGTVDKSGISTSYSTTSKQLAEDVVFIVRSLGGKATISEKIPSFSYRGIKKIGRLSYIVHLSLPIEIPPFTLPRKKDRYIPRSRYVPTRYVDRVEYIGIKQAQCILIDDPKHLYITDDFIVTHNTMLTVAAGLTKVLEEKKYSSLVITRPTIPVGKHSDLGFLPGNIYEKFEPWMRPIRDQVEVMFGQSGMGEDQFEDMVNNGIIKVEPLAYIRGRSFHNSFIVLDESQNISRHEIKTFLTRAGENTKVVLTGDILQIDNSTIDSVSNGLTQVVEKFKDEAIAGHVTLLQVERGKLAELAASKL